MRHLLLPAVFTAFAAPAGADELIEIQGRKVRLDAQTQLIVDDEILPPGSAPPAKRGLRAVATFPGAQRGGAPAAATVVFSYAVRGAVTSVEPLRVLGQEVTVTADTGATGLPGGSIGNVELGDHLDVSGYVDTNSSLLASFIEYLPSPTPRWLLSGYVTAIAGDEAQLGPQRVSLAGVAPVDCGDALTVGRFVEIRATAIDGFQADSLLDTVTRLTCVEPVPLGTPGALGALTGLVGEILSPTAFRFGPYTVTYDAKTEFRFGSAEDLVTGASMEVDGVFGENLALAAQGIQFDAPTIRLEGPATPADVQPGADGRVTLLGNEVRRSAQLRDRDGVYLNGITQARQIELRGYLDRLGNRWATRARLRGAPDPADARAGGPVTGVARPQLSVLGLTLDSTGATFEDPAGDPIDADAFFAGALPGALVEQTGTWNGTDTLLGGVLALIAPLDPPPPDPGARALIVGTYGGSDRLFADGFD
ncbi:DUF5666 domain-containing protein [Dokdonella sp.]|uniref:DUF5666 domain-containing protein n=1 Tax=Dokdonella sp. TaxID=2291710 RepID=UPI001B123C93|nr:DUF5666 domain-containing protein [Dokdonella sp.]MBO9664455.1 hypothetical protein [Dokdonella sp.]